jgi:predicted methyltransferase
MLLGATGAVAADDALKGGHRRQPPHAGQRRARRARHPYETLSFFGIKPTMTVVELAPGGGWYTEILAPYLRDNGKLIGAGRRRQAQGGMSLHAARRQSGGVRQGALGVFEPPRLQLRPAGSVDMVLTFRNMHNWVERRRQAEGAVQGSIYTSLKPGGVFGVVDHRLPESMTQDAKASAATCTRRM